MYKIILFVILILIYWFAEGATEGYIWANNDQQMENVIIKGGSEGNGILDYHSWRFLEVLGIHGAILCAILFGINRKSYIYIGIGSMAVGMFIYERLLNYVAHGTLFKEPGWIFYMAGIEIPRYFWQDLVLIIIGWIAIAFGVYYYLKEKE